MKLVNALEQLTLDAPARGLSPSTVGWYRRRLSTMIAFLADQDVHRINEVTIDHLRAFVASLRSQDTRWSDHPYRPSSRSSLSPSTVHGYVRAVRVFFHWLVDEGAIATSPATRLKLPRLPDEPPKAIAPEDLERLLAVAENDPRDYAIVCFLADTGCRVGGLAGLSLDDLDLRGGRAVVQEKGRGGCKSRAVYFNGRTCAALARWLAARPTGNSEAVFLRQDGGGGLTAGGIYQALRRLAKRANVTGRFNPHSFRHGWARAALENGASLADVSQVPGHTDPSATMRFYARRADHELKERHGRFSPLGTNDKPSTD